MARSNSLKVTLREFVSVNRLQKSIYSPPASFLNSHLKNTLATDVTELVKHLSNGKATLLLINRFFLRLTSEFVNVIHSSLCVNEDTFR